VGSYAGVNSFKLSLVKRLEGVLVEFWSGEVGERKRVLRIGILSSFWRIIVVKWGRSRVSKPKKNALVRVLCTLCRGEEILGLLLLGKYSMDKYWGLLKELKVGNIRIRLNCKD